MSKQRFTSVWDAIEDTPAGAENMKLRSALMMALEHHIKSHGWTQAEAARRLGVTQPRVSDLMGWMAPSGIIVPGWSRHRPIRGAIHGSD